MMTDTRPQAVGTLEAHIAALVAQGYEVAFTAGFGADPVAAHVEKPGDPDAGCTALAYTAAAALWAASPLHADDEPFPAAAPVIDSTLWACAGCGGQCIGRVPFDRLCRGCEPAPRCGTCGLYPIDHRGGECVYPRGEAEKDVSGLSADMSDVFLRLDALEGDQAKTERALVWALVNLIAADSPDGELAQRLKAQRAAEAASTN